MIYHPVKITVKTGFVFPPTDTPVDDIRLDCRKYQKPPHATSNRNKILFLTFFSSLFIQVERDSKWSDCRREQVNSFHLIVHFCPTTLLHCWHTFVELVNTIIHSICSRAIVFVVNLPATNSPVDTSVAVSQWVKLRCQLLAKVNGSLTDADLQIAKSTTILTGRRKCR